MTKTKFNQLVEMYEDKTYNETCYKLKLELIKKVCNCKAMPDEIKMNLIDMYTTDCVINWVVVEAIKYYNKK